MMRKSLSRLTIGRTSLIRLASSRTPRRYSTALLDDTHQQLTQSVDEIVASAERRIISLFESNGRENYIGEDCTIAEHSIQSANAAAKNGEDAIGIIACLLHDVGHLAGLEAGFEPGMDGCGTPEHELVGAELLGAMGFPDDVAFLAHRHVSAKRYLVATVPGYYEKLSDASKTTLRHQGGPMSAEEVVAAEADPRWPLVLRMRGYDEAGKDPDAAFTSLSAFMPMLRDMLRSSVASQLARDGGADGTEENAVREKQRYPLSAGARSYVLSSEQQRHFRDHGYLVLRNVLPPAFDADTLARMADQAAALPNAACYPWLLHHERSKVDDQVRLCRVENFVKHHEAWSAIALGFVQDVVSQAFREPASLFKDKINFKGPGGGAFLAHQDATAYVTNKLATRHISVSVSIDHADDSNGPLQIPSHPGLHTRGIFPHHKGVIEPEVQQALEPWAPVLVGPGDIVLFDSFLPHRSEANLSSTWRRSAYLTYNVAREGDLHGAYYRTKRQAFADGSAGSISINDDFGGDIVSASQ